MTLQERIAAMVKLGELMAAPTEKLEAVIHYAYLKNNWFTKENTRKALKALSEEYLQEEKLNNWTAHYQVPMTTSPKKIGIIMAGNIPLVGFQDMLCCFMAGHCSYIKLSDKDKYLLPFLLEYLFEQFPATQSYFKVIEKLTGFDAVIATGSNNSARYFETYFGKYPNIIRKNRNSVAILTGKETTEQLARLGTDVFQYFGLGCRNVSKVYVPKDYNFDVLLEALHEFREIVHHNKYKNNFDYNYTMLILNKVKHLSTGAILLCEDKSLTSRIAQLHYEFYENTEQVIEELQARKAEIQCVVTDDDLSNIQTIDFGQTQAPTLFDYPDGEDVMVFLLGL